MIGECGSALSEFNADEICQCGHPKYEHHTVRYFVPVDNLEITYCEHGQLKPKQPCDCPQFTSRVP
jgi:hypothetical protein